MIQVGSKVSRLYSCSLCPAVSSVTQYYLAYSTEQYYSSYYGLLVYRSIVYDLMHMRTTMYMYLVSLRPSVGFCRSTPGLHCTQSLDMSYYDGF